MKVTRREFLQVVTGAGLVSASGVFGCGSKKDIVAHEKPVVVVGQIDKVGEAIVHDRMTVTLTNLVAVPTVSRSDESIRPSGEVCDYTSFETALIAEARGRGLQAERLGQHAGNLIVKRSDEDPNKPTILLVTHCDTVPVNNASAWTERDQDPFKLTRDGHQLWGKGAADNKGAIVVGLESLSLDGIQNAPVNLRMLIGRDEEIGSKLGYEYLAKNGLIGGYDAALVLDAAPAIHVASSGVVQAKIDTMEPIALYCALREYKKERREVSSSLDIDAKYPPGQDIEYPKTSKLWGRLSITIVDIEFEGSDIQAIRGGVKTNQIPRSCRIKCDKDSVRRIRDNLNPKFRLNIDPKESEWVEIVGKDSHSAYPHLGKNPVEEALRLASIIGVGKAKKATISLDIRTIPEEKVDDVARKLSGIVNQVKSSAIVNEGGKPMTLPAFRLADTKGLKADRMGSILRVVTEAFRENGLDIAQSCEFGADDAPTLAALGIPAIPFGIGGYDAKIHSEDEHADLRLMYRMIRVVEHVARNWH